jgi:hypothetical protein
MIKEYAAGEALVQFIKPNNSPITGQPVVQMGLGDKIKNWFDKKLGRKPQQAEIRQPQPQEQNVESMSSAPIGAFLGVNKSTNASNSGSSSSSTASGATASSYPATKKPAVVSRLIPGLILPSTKPEENNFAVEQSKEYLDYEKLEGIIYDLNDLVQFVNSDKLQYMLTAPLSEDALGQAMMQVQFSADFHKSSKDTTRNIFEQANKGYYNVLNAEVNRRLSNICSAYASFYYSSLLTLTGKLI